MIFRFGDDYFPEFDYFLFDPKIPALTPGVPRPLFPTCEPKPEPIPIYLFYKMSSIMCIPYLSCICCISWFVGN